MSKPLAAIDQLNRAKWLFEAALMAVQGMQIEEESAALDRLLFEAIAILGQGIDIVRSNHD